MWLCLTFNFIEDKGIQALAKIIKNLRNLKVLKLYLVNNNFDSKSILYIGEALNYVKKLELLKINFNSNGIQDSDLL